MGRRRSRVASGIGIACVLGFVAPVASAVEQGSGQATIARPTVPPAVAAAAPEFRGGAEASSSDEGSELSLLGGTRRDDPISINSEELEVLQLEGGRRLVFSRNVEVLHGEVTLNADRLEALYPQGASQPAELLASGHVRGSEGDRRARCDEAVYHRSTHTIVCRGEAEVLQGCDRMTGAEIEFDLDRDRVRVMGAASVEIRPEDGDGSDCAAAEGLGR